MCALSQTRSSTVRAWGIGHASLTTSIRQVRKTHPEHPHARVIRLSTDEGYGCIETPDGREVYFHKNSVLGGDFKHVKVGSSVIFVEEAGDRGPQASSVRLVGGHRRHKIVKQAGSE